MTEQQKKQIELFFNQPHTFGWYLGYDKLTEIHSNWIKYLFYSKEDVCLQAHRNSYKTTCLVVGIILLLIHNPDLTFAIIRKSESGASSILQEIEKHFQSERLMYIYEILGIKLELKKFNQVKMSLPTKKSVTKENNIEIFGKGGNITGSHFDVIIIDDIITDKDRYSKAERESTKNYIRELHNIKKITGRIIATGTPWHEDDAFQLLPTPQLYPIGTVSLLPEEIEKIKELRLHMTPSLYAANYELKHIADENRLFSDIHYKKWNETLNCKAYLDPAYSGTNTTALTLVQEQGNDILIKGFVWRENITNLYEKIINICNTNFCLNLFCEANADHGMSQKELQKRYPMTQAVNEKENKHYKIVFYIKQFFDRLYFDEDCQSEYLEQIMYYEEGQEPDDAPDSLASILRQCFYANINLKDSVRIVEQKNDWKF